MFEIFTIGSNPAILPNIMRINKTVLSICTKVLTKYADINNVQQ